MDASLIVMFMIGLAVTITYVIAMMRLNHAGRKVAAARKKITEHLNK